MTGSSFVWASAKWVCGVASYRLFIDDFIGVIRWDRFSFRNSHQRGRKEERGGEGRHKKAIETSIVKFVARFRCSPFPTGVTPCISSLDITSYHITSQWVINDRQAASGMPQIKFRQLVGFWNPVAAPAVSVLGVPTGYILSIRCKGTFKGSK